MRKAKWIVRVLVTGLGILALAGCTLPAAYSTPGEVENKAQNAAYTAAAATIAAQLTLIAAPTVTGETPIAAGETVTATVTAMEDIPLLTTTPEALSETLPATSTPLPSSTPIPSDTPTVTPTGTNTLTPTVTPVLPSPTPTSVNPEASLGEPDWSDTFQSGNNWPLYNDEHVEMHVGNNLLSMIALKADSRNPYDAWMLSWPQLSDFYLEATITPGECKGVDRYGILARAPGFNPVTGYVFGFSCDGKYSFRIWDGSNYINLITWTLDGSIKQGADQTNVLGLRAEGSQISLYANGNLLTELEDQTFSAGYFGLFVGAAQTNYFTIQVSKVSYWSLPRP